MEEGRKEKVLFVRRHNSEYAGDRFEVFSAGLESRPIHWVDGLDKDGGK